jgi:hypothetical protein
MIATIGISSTKQKFKDIEQLPVARIYETKDKDYIVLDDSLITKAIIESLKRLETGQPSLVLIEIQVLPMSERKKRSTFCRGTL